MYPSEEGDAGIPEYISIISNIKRFVNMPKTELSAQESSEDFIGEAPDSICPKGWRMVGNEGEINGKEEKSWINLFAKYYGGTRQGSSSTEENINTYLLLNTFSLLRFGYYYWGNGGLHDRAWGGNYWSYSYPIAHHLSFEPTWLYYQGGNAKGFGFSLRCVARFPKNEPSVRESSENHDTKNELSAQESSENAVI